MKTPSPDKVYWRKTRTLTLLLLSLWIVVTFVVSWHAGRLNSVVILGFPLGFYMGAQGALLVYLAIVGLYCRLMNRLDSRYGPEDGKG